MRVRGQWNRSRPHRERRSARGPSAVTLVPRDERRGRSSAARPRPVAIDEAEHRRDLRQRVDSGADQRGRDRPDLPGEARPQAQSSRGGRRRADGRAGRGCRGCGSRCARRSAWRRRRRRQPARSGCGRCCRACRAPDGRAGRGDHRCPRAPAANFSSPRAPVAQARVDCGSSVSASTMPPMRPPRRERITRLASRLAALVLPARRGAGDARLDR